MFEKGSAHMKWGEEVGGCVEVSKECACSRKEYINMHQRWKRNAQMQLHLAHSVMLEYNRMELGNFQLEKVEFKNASSSPCSK